LIEAASAIPVETHVPIDPQVEEFFDAEGDHDNHHTMIASPERNEQLIENQMAPQEINVTEGTVQAESTTGAVTTRMSNRSNKGRPATKMNLHKSVKKGIQQYGDVAIHAVEKEFIQLFYEKNALSPVYKKDICKSKRIMRSSMFLTEKYDATGNFERIKARLVADGSIQEESANNHSPTAKHQSIVMCLTDKGNRYAMIVDVTGAYLEADMDEDEYMSLDEYLTQILISIIPSLSKYACNGKLYCKITKAMYGCKQSAKLWYEHLVNILKEIGFKPNAMDNCVLNGMIDGKSTTIIVYVDDLMVLSEDVKTLETVSSLLKGRFNEVRCKITNDFSYLGMHIKIHNGYVHMSMEKFIGDLLRDYGNLITKVYSVPAIDGLCEIDNKAKSLVGEQKKMFHTIVAKLLYLAKKLRIDICMCVAYLCTRIKDPNTDDWKKLIRVLGYIKMTSSKKKVIRQDGTVARLEQYTDASFGIHADGKSHNGTCIMWGDVCVMAASRKQKITAKEPTEAELIGASDEIKEVEWCTEFLQEQGHHMLSPILYQDNRSAIALMTDGIGAYRNKQIRARAGWMREKSSSKSLYIVYKPTNEMLADVLTKPLGGEKFYNFNCKLMGSSDLLDDRRSLKYQEITPGRKRVIKQELRTLKVSSKLNKTDSKKKKSDDVSGKNKGNVSVTHRIVKYNPTIQKAKNDHVREL